MVLAMAMQTKCGRFHGLINCDGVMLQYGALPTNYPDPDPDSG